MTEVRGRQFCSGPAHIGEVDKLQGRGVSDDPSLCADLQREGGLCVESHIGARIIRAVGSRDGVVRQICEEEVARETSAVGGGDFPPKTAGTSASGLTPWLKLDVNGESLPTRTVS